MGHAEDLEEVDSEEDNMSVSHEVQDEKDKESSEEREVANELAGGTESQGKAGEGTTDESKMTLRVLLS